MRCQGGDEGGKLLTLQPFEPPAGARYQQFLVLFVLLLLLPLILTVVLLLLQQL